MKTNVLKKIIILFLSFLLFMSAFYGCGDVEIDGVLYHSVTFKEKEYNDIIIKVEDGKSIEDENVPQVHGKIGYTVVWDITDFINVKKSFTVNAIFTPNEYRIYYELKTGEEFLEEGTSVFYDESVGLYYSVAVFDSSFTLKRLKDTVNYAWSVNGLKDGIIEDGIYTIPQNVTVKSVDKSDSSWGPEVKPVKS